MSGNLASIFGAAGFRASEYVVIEESPEEQFRDALSAIGCIVDHVIADGKNHRVNGRDDKKKSVCYILSQFGDIWAGSFVDWRDGDHHRWASTSNREMTWSERRNIDVKMAALRKAAEEEKKRWQDEVAGIAEEALSACQPASDNHPYLQNKRVKSHGLMQRADELLVPMVNGDGKTIRGYQSIAPSGKKLFLSGAQSKGCYHALTGDTSVIYVGEGYATCATVFEATGSQCYVAFSANNLPDVARHAKKAHPTSRVVILVDNDDAGREWSAKCEGCDRAEATGAAGADFNDMSHADIRLALGLVTQEEDEVEPVIDSIESEFNEIPDHLITLNGFMGQVQHYTLKTAPMPNKPAAAMGAIALACSILGNKVQTTTGLRSNNYMILVAGTGQGKEYPRKINKTILIACGLQDTHIGGDEIASGQGLMTAAARRPMSLFQLDEFGMWLASATSPKAGAWERAILSNFMKLHSGAGSVVPGQERADQRANPRIDIAYPCVSMNCTTTASELIPALRSGQTSSGLLNRMMFLLTKTKRQRRNMKARLTAPPFEVVEWVKAARNYHHEMAGMAPDNPVTVEMNEEAEAMMLAYEDELMAIMNQGTLYESMYVRAWEHAAKLALVHAMSRMSVEAMKAFDQCVIDVQDVSWAVGFVRFSFSEMVRMIESRVADNEFESQCKEVLRIIRKGKTRGMTEAEISRYSVTFRTMNGVARAAVFDVLRRDQMATLVPFSSASGRGKTRTAYVAREYVENVEEK
jgi:phage/plasmid primase-like uncharacterized protein